MGGGWDSCLRTICITLILFFTYVLFNLAKHFESQLAAESSNPVLPGTPTDILDLRRKLKNA